MRQFSSALAAAAALLGSMSSATIAGTGGGEPGDPSITITVKKHVWDPTMTMVRPHLEGTVANAQGYTSIVLEKSTVGPDGKASWTPISDPNNLTVKADGSGSWTIEGVYQVNATATYRVLMKKLPTDSDDAATTKSATGNITALTK